MKMLRAKALCLSLIAFTSVQGETTPGSSAENFGELRLNGAGPDRSGRLRFAIGVPNVLEVRTTEPAAALRADLIAPDGTRHPVSAAAAENGAWAVVLGPLLANPQFSYADGLVWETGYGLEVGALDTEGKEIAALTLRQTSNEKARAWKYGQPINGKAGYFAVGAPGTHRFNPRYSEGVMVDFSLNPKVLRDNDTVQILAGLRETASEAAMSFQLLGVDATGREVFSEPVLLARGPAAPLVSIDVSGWPDGPYTLRLAPVINGIQYPDGPTLTYHRDRTQSGGNWISPVLPWRLPVRADAPSLTLTNFSDPDHVQIPQGWEIVGSGTTQSVVSRGASQPLVIRPQLSGYYAVYLTAHDRGCLIAVGGENLVRATKSAEEQFVTVADLTGQDIHIHGFDWIQKEGKQTGLRSLRFEPVTAEARTLLQKLGNPELPLTGIDDWLEYFIGAARISKDQIRMILAGQQELGIRQVAWSTARSWVEYESALPETSRFPVKPLAEAVKTYPQATVYEGKARILALGCPLREALQIADTLGMPLDAWMGLNRHYGADALGGIAASEWFVQHPEWRRWRKKAQSPDRSEVSFYFPEVREERLRILEETSKIGAKGLVLDATRQAPLLLYHPDMVAEYTATFGSDPQKFDGSDEQKYRHWIAWRAEHFTRMLRDLGSRTPDTRITVRIPATDLTTNLALGLDVETWLKDGLVDQLMLNPLEISGGNGLSSIRPYQELCQSTKVPLTVGVGATWMAPPSLPAALRRAEGLHRAGVKFIDLYEAEIAAFLNDVRWAAGLFGSPEMLAKYYRTSNLEACYPIIPETASLGLDNHSRWADDGWTTSGGSLNAL